MEFRHRDLSRGWSLLWMGGGVGRVAGRVLVYGPAVWAGGLVRRLKWVCVRRERPVVLRGSRVYWKLPLPVHRRRLRSQLHLNRYTPRALVQASTRCSPPQHCTAAPSPHPQNLLPQPRPSQPP